MPNITLLIAAILSAALIIFPTFFVAWMAIGAWGLYCYMIHEEFTLAGQVERAHHLVVLVGAAVAAGFALMGTAYVLMAISMVLTVLALRQILPRHFQAEPALAVQQ